MLQIAHQLAATVLGVENRHALPDQQVPRMVNLAAINDTGRMNGSPFNGGRSCLGLEVWRANSRSHDSDAYVSTAAAQRAGI